MSWSFDKNTLNNTTIGGKKTTFKGKHNKLLFVSLEMIKALVWDDIFSRTKLAKATMKRLLEKNDRKYTLWVTKNNNEDNYTNKTIINENDITSSELEIKL